jgi:hypothetical protein
MLNHRRQVPGRPLAEQIDGPRPQPIAAACPRNDAAQATAAAPAGKRPKRDWLAEALSCDRERNDRR